MNRKTVEQIQAILAESGHTLENLWEFCGNSNSAVSLSVPGRNHAPVYVERFGNDAALVSEDGRILGQPLVGSGYEFYIGRAGLDRVCTFRTTLIPTGYRDNRGR